jgi:S1-C subfamily serine protease
VGTLPPIAPQEPPAPPRRRGRWAASLLVPALVGGAVAFGVTRLTDDDPVTRTVTVVSRDDAGSDAPAPSPRPSTPTDEGGRSVQDIVRDASPGVVLVQQAGGLGSGFLIDDDGHILTNAHVVEDARTVQVTYADGTRQQARVLAADETIDLAVLDVERPPPSARALPLGRSKGLAVGDSVVAIGNPLGFERTATTGIVSAVKRQICSPNDSSIANAIQTDAAINQGNSGGPLLDRLGRVVGINSQIVSQGGGFEGIGFAVPIDTVRPVTDAVIEGGSPEHAWIGIVGEPLTPDVAAALGVAGTTGVALRTIDERGPAAKAGLRGSSAPDDAPPKGGDIIVEVAGEQIRDFGDLSQEIGSRRVGEPLRITVLRNGTRVGVTLTLADRPADLGGTCQ